MDKLLERIDKYLKEENIEFSYLKSWLKNFDSLYKEFKQDVKSKDVTGTKDSFERMKSKLNDLDKQLERMNK